VTFGLLECIFYAVKVFDAMFTATGIGRSCRETLAVVAFGAASLESVETLQFGQQLFIWRSFENLTEHLGSLEVVVVDLPELELELESALDDVSLV
jgi:hypothetical protein